ncbi:hypothetical protein SAMN05443246_3333 [Paenibacillus sp. GP183]|nr:hypothetical protein SAMN05443246_3333 [Paenibacillus sp. GP183]
MLLSPTGTRSTLELLTTQERVPEKSIITAEVMLCSCPLRGHALCWSYFLQQERVPEKNAHHHGGDERFFYIYSKACSVGTKATHAAKIIMGTL